MQNKKLREEVSDLKQEVANLKQFVAFVDNRSVNQHKAVVDRLAYVGEALAALIGIVGADKVEAKVTESRAQRKAAAEKKGEEGVARLIEQGILVKAETVIPSGFIVGMQTLESAEGNVGSTRRVQCEVSDLPEEAIPLYLGKKAGDTIEFGGGKVTLVEVYTLDASKVEAAAQAAIAQPQQPTAADAAGAVEQKAA